MRARYETAHWTQAVLLFGLLSVGITAATTAQAGLKLFTGEWYVKAFGNECGGMGTTGPHCTGTTGDSAMYSNLALPLGFKCNPNNPRCPYASTPTDGKGKFSRLGGSLYMALYCYPWTNWGGGGATKRPAKGATITSGPPPTGSFGPIPPLYRNPSFFTSLGNAKSTSCPANETGFTTQNKTRFGKNRGMAQVGNPVTGTWSASTTGTPGKGGFNFAAAPEKSIMFGLRTTGQFGQFEQLYPYMYSYTYATLRNDKGSFGPGQGPGNFNITYSAGKGNTVASIKVKQGAAKFGGTMQMLGALQNRACFMQYYPFCSIGENNWRYDVIGASGVNTVNGVVTQGFLTTYTALYYHTGFKQTSTITVHGSRFPWTTGSVTVTAKLRGPHKTVEYAHGYDNRNTNTTTMNSGTGTIQLVSPVLTRWFGTKDYETGGIAILKLKFLPPTPPDEMASGTVGVGGGSVSTGTTASISDPVETTVTVPSGTAGGMVVITEGPITATPPSGFSFLGQEVDITAPAGTVANPLVITFSLFAPGMAPSSIEIFKATVLVGACVAAGANPDPCIESRTSQGANNVVIVVRTSTASLWNLPEPGLLLQLVSGVLGLALLDKRRRHARR